jgi:hypothetical protein
MPFIIKCPLCGLDEDGQPIAAYRDAQNNQAWIHYAKHIIECHPDNFRVHWAEHALKDKGIAYVKPEQVEHEKEAVVEVKKVQPVIVPEVKKGSIINAVVNKVKSKSKEVAEVVQEMPQYEPEEENPFKETITRMNKKKLPET